LREQQPSQQQPSQQQPSQQQQQEQKQVVLADRAVVRRWRAFVSELSEEAQSKRRRARSRLEEGYKRV
jgi:hypothetical protein